MKAALRGLARERELIAFVVLAVVPVVGVVGPGGPRRRHGQPLPRPARVADGRRRCDGDDRRAAWSAPTARTPGCAPLVALALSPLFVGAVAVAISRATGDGPSLGTLADVPGLPAWPWPGVFLIAFLVGGVGEETGWRDAALVLTVPWRSGSSRCSGSPAAWRARRCASCPAGSWGWRPARSSSAGCTSAAAASWSSRWRTPQQHGQRHAWRRRARRRSRVPRRHRRSGGGAARRPSSAHGRRPLRGNGGRPASEFLSVGPARTGRLTRPGVLGPEPEVVQRPR